MNQLCLGNKTKRPCIKSGFEVESGIPEGKITEWGETVQHVIDESTNSAMFVCLFVFLCVLSFWENLNDYFDTRPFKNNAILLLLSFSVHNTLYLEVHCPTVTPSVVVIWDSGRNVVDFGNVSLGKELLASSLLNRHLYDSPCLWVSCV